MSLRDLQIYSPAANAMIPVRQIVSGFETEFEDGLIFRRNRRPTITLHSDQTEGESSIPFQRIKPKIEQALGVDQGELARTRGHYLTRMNTDLHG